MKKLWTWQRIISQNTSCDDHGYDTAVEEDTCKEVHYGNGRSEEVGGGFTAYTAHFATAHGCGWTSGYSFTVVIVIPSCSGRR